MAKEIEMFQISIEKRQKKIHDCTRYDDVFWCSVLIFFFFLSDLTLYFFLLNYFFPRFSRLFSLLSLFSLSSLSLLYSALLSFSLFSLLSLLSLLFSLFSSLLSSSLFSSVSLCVNRTTKKLTKSMRKISRDILTLQTMVHASASLFSIEHETHSHFVKLSNSVQHVVSGYIYENIHFQSFCFFF